MSVIASLFPSVEVLGNFDDFAMVLEWSKLKQDVWILVATALGDPTLEDFGTVAAVDNIDYTNAIEETKLNAVDKARLNITVNAVRKKLGVGVSSIMVSPSPAGAQAPSGATAPQGPDNTGNKVAMKVSQFFDQACRYEVPPIAEDAILTKWNRWKAKMWLGPPPHVDMSDNQLSVLARLQDLNHNLLAFDMGVWGPFGTRRERQYVLTAYHQNQQGDWVAREVPGAQTVDEWVEGWNFATTGFVMGDVVEKGVAEAYRDYFAALAKIYPRAWWVACQAEWQLRFEWAVQERRRQAAFHAECPSLSKFNPEKPWNSVLLAAIQGVESLQYWEKSYKEKARQWMETDTARRNPSWVSRQEATYTPVEGNVSNRQAQAQNPPGTGRKALKRKFAGERAQTQAQQPFPTVPKVGSSSGGVEWWNERRPDGRFMYSENKMELCYAYNRNAGGCGSTCPCNPPRAHQCEWCRLGHRAIDCPSHPNWIPPPAPGKGGGRGKGGKPSRK